jgi:hypothetical protein
MVEPPSLLAKLLDDESVLSLGLTTSWTMTLVGVSS